MPEPETARGFGVGWRRDLRLAPRALQQLVYKLGVSQSELAGHGGGGDSPDAVEPGQQGGRRAASFWLLCIEPLERPTPVEVTDLCPVTLCPLVFPIIKGME